MSSDSYPDKKSVELAALSKEYRESRQLIREAIIKQLREGRPQRLIARDFGVRQPTISKIAKKAGISYYKAREKKESAE